MRGNFNRGRGGGGGFRGRGGFRGKPYERNSFKGGDGNQSFKMRKSNDDGDNFHMKKTDNSFGGERKSFSPRGGFNRGGRGFRGGFQGKRGGGQDGRGSFKGGFDHRQKKKEQQNDEDDDSEDASESDSSEQPAKKPEKPAKKEGKNFMKMEKKPKSSDEDDDDSDDDEDDLSLEDDDDDDDSSVEQKPKQVAKLDKGKLQDGSKQQKAFANNQKGKGPQIDLQGKRKPGPEEVSMLTKKPKVDNKAAKQKASVNEEEESDDEDDDDDDDEDDDDEDDEDDDDDDDEEEEEDDESEDQKPKEVQKGKAQANMNEKGKAEKFSMKVQGVQETKNANHGNAVKELGSAAPATKKIKELAREAQSARSVWLEKTNAHRLYVGQLPLHCTVDDLKALSTDILDVFIPTSGKRRRKTLFAFLSFKDAKKAEENLRRLQNTKIGNQNIVVSLAREKPPQTQQQQEQAASLKHKNLRSVYVSGLPEDTLLPQVVNSFPKASKAVLEQQKRSAFLTFTNEEDAAEAVKMNQGLKIGGALVSVDFSRIAGEQVHQSKYMTPASKESPFKQTPAKPALNLLTPGATPKDATKSILKDTKSTPAAKISPFTPKVTIPFTPKDIAKSTPNVASKFTPKDAAKSASKDATKFLSRKDFKSKFEQMDSDDDDSDEKPTVKMNKSQGSARKDSFKMLGKKGTPVNTRQEDSDDDDDDDSD